MITDLRMKKLQELHEFQALLEQNALTQQEFYGTRVYGTKATGT